MSLQRRRKPGIPGFIERVELLFSLFQTEQWWCEFFPDLQLPDLDCEHCPMLIGIMLRASREETGLSLFGYGCQVLQRCDRLPGRNTRSTLEKVLQTLCAFKAGWNLNRHFVVPFDVVRWTRLSPKIFNEYPPIASPGIFRSPFEQSIESISSTDSSASRSETSDFRSFQRWASTIDTRLSLFPRTCSIAQSDCAQCKTTWWDRADHTSSTNRTICFSVVRRWISTVSVEESALVVLRADHSFYT